MPLSVARRTSDENPLRKEGVIFTCCSDIRLLLREQLVEFFHNAHLQAVDADGFAVQIGLSGILERLQTVGFHVDVFIGAVERAFHFLSEREREQPPVVAVGNGEFQSVHPQCFRNFERGHGFRFVRIVPFGFERFSETVEIDRIPVEIVRMHGRRLQGDEFH